MKSIIKYIYIDVLVYHYNIKYDGDGIITTIRSHWPKLCYNYKVLTSNV